MVTKGGFHGTEIPSYPDRPRAQDPQLESALVVAQGKLNQAQLEDYQSDALDLYKAKEPLPVNRQRLFRDGGDLFLTRVESFSVIVFD